MIDLMLATLLHSSPIDPVLSAQAHPLSNGDCNLMFAPGTGYWTVPCNLTAHQITRLNTIIIPTGTVVYVERSSTEPRTGAIQVEIRYQDIRWVVYP